MRYFPDPVSGWLFVSGLAAVLAIASYTDERYTKVPKWLTIPALLAGLVLSTLRGLLLGLHGMPVWLMSEPGPALGAADGLLFALTGAVVGFVIFFGIWLLGGCGGGDVKLFAAVGAWVGPYLAFLIFILSLVLLTFCLMAVVAWRTLSGKRPVPTRNGRSPVVVRFSLVAALAVMLVTLWAFRVDLGLMKPRAAAATAEARHAR